MVLIFFAASSGYHCAPGQGQADAEYVKYGVCSRSECQRHCDDEEQKCFEFDYTFAKKPSTQSCKSDGCRLYATRVAEEDPGNEQREYCSKAYNGYFDIEIWSLRKHLYIK